jgi:hypothetical protein
MRRVSLIALSALAVAGCSATLGSYTDTPSERIEGLLQGPYFLPRSVFNIAVTQTDKGEGFTISKKTEADPSTRLIYKLEPSEFSDDVIEVTSNEAGLLTKITSDTTDRSGDIAIKIAEAIFAGVTQSSSGPSVTDFPEGGLATFFAASYDPFHPKEAADVRERLRNAGTGYCILVGDEVRRGVALCDGSKGNPTPYVAPALGYAERYPGIYYRRAVPTPVRIYRRDAATKKWLPYWIGSESLFDQSDLYEVKIDRTAFVRKQTTMVFSNGSLTNIKLEKPSEALAFVGIPVKIARIAFAMPLAGLQRDTGLLEAETKNLEAQSKLINTQSALVKLQLQQAGSAVVATPTQ